MKNTLFNKSIIVLVFVFFNLNSESTFNECKLDGIYGKFDSRFCMAINALAREAKRTEIEFEVASFSELGSESENIVSVIASPRNKFCFYGPPGNGKTSAAKKIAQKLGAVLKSYSGAGIVKEYTGSGAHKIEDIFEEAKKLVDDGLKVVVFVDEINVIADTSDTEYRSEHNAALKALILELDKIKDNPRIIFICATNNFEKLSPEFKDRMNISLEVKNPDRALRRECLEDYSNKHRIGLGSIRKNSKSNLIEDLEKRKKQLLDKYAKKTDGVSIRQLENFVETLAIMQQEQEITEQDCDKLTPKPIKSSGESNWTLANVCTVISTTVGVLTLGFVTLGGKGASTNVQQKGNTNAKPA